MNEMMPMGAPKRGHRWEKGPKAPTWPGCSCLHPRGMKQPPQNAASPSPGQLLPIEPRLVAGFRTKCKNCQELRPPTPALGKETENVPFFLARPKATPFIRCSLEKAKKTLPGHTAPAAGEEAEIWACCSARRAFDIFFNDFSFFFNDFLFFFSPLVLKSVCQAGLEREANPGFSTATA